MSEACDACLRRGGLVGALSGRIEGLLSPSRKKPAGLFALNDEQLASILGREGREIAERFVAGFDAGRERERLRLAGVGATCRHDYRYPPRLKDLGDPPAVLFHCGRDELLESLEAEPVATIVGARRASPYGLGVAHELARGLAAAGVIVVSGLALGIDAEAHRGALEADGVTVAVLACGPDVAYPRRHHSLHRRIVERGLVLSELPPGCPPRSWGFPARNRLMAAMAGLTVVVEAAEASGTLITAEVAQQLGRTLGAVPGRVTARIAAGGNALLREGAAVIRGPQDALDELLGVGVLAVEQLELASLDPTQLRLLDAVEAGMGIDAICERVDVSAAAARAGLAALEAKGLVRREGLSSWEPTGVATSRR